MKIKEVMITKIISIKPDDNVYEALNLLFKMHISGLPVIDNKGKLAGMFTEKEIISGILPSYIENIGKFVYEDNSKAVKQKVFALKNLKVMDIMRKEVVTIDQDSTLCEAAHIFLTQKARRIIVLDKAKNLVGIVAREDVLKALFAEYK